MKVARYPAEVKPDTVTARFPTRPSPAISGPFAPILRAGRFPYAPSVTLTPQTRRAPGVSACGQGVCDVSLVSLSSAARVGAGIFPPAP